MATSESRQELQQAIGRLQRRSTVVLIGRIVLYLAYAWIAVSLLILAFGFFLQLFGASTDASFVRWVYRHLADVMEPFRGMFPQQEVRGGESTLDVSILFAMFVYLLALLAAQSIIDWLTARRDRLEWELRRDEEVLRQYQAAQGQPAPQPMSPPAATSPTAPMSAPPTGPPPPPQGGQPPRAP